MKLPLGIQAFKRNYGSEPEIILKNRFFEVAPNNLETQQALLNRPATSLLVQVGDGPIRANFAQPGLFGGDLFSVSATELYRYDGTTALLIQGVITDTAATPRFAATNVGDIQRLFISDGLLLQYFQGPTYEATLSVGVGTIDDDKVVIDGTYYQFTSGSVDSGTPAGNAGNPWLVNVGINNAAALSNLRKAINASGVAGTDYSTALVANTRAFSNQNSSTTMTLRARLGGPPDPALAVSVIVVTTDDTLSWSSGQLVPGVQALYGIETPDGVPIIAIDVVNSYVLCVAGDPFPQRVYFILPGEVTIDPLNFFEAESEPDRINDIVCVGDQAWLIGQSSTDVYYTTGVSAAPFARAQGRPFPIGGVGGTCVKLVANLIIVGVDNTVYVVADGPSPISTNGIAERVRTARDTERDNA